jgi:hypothetical protein
MGKYTTNDNAFKISQGVSKMILGDTLDKVRETTDKLNISVPVISQEFDHANNEAIGNIDFDEDIKIWIPRSIKL